MNIELSKRELEVLKLLLSGYLQKQVAHELGISESRVQDVKRIIKKKWQVNSEIEFVLTAIKKGYLEIGAKDYQERIPSSAQYASEINVNYSYLPSPRNNFRVIFD